jgi:hypothetical protein
MGQDSNNSGKNVRIAVNHVMQYGDIAKKIELLHTQWIP